MKLNEVFLQHPRSVGEGYFQHLCHAMKFSAEMALGAVVCFVHAFIPCAFERRGSEIISCLHDRMVVNRVVPSSAQTDPSHHARANAAQNSL